MHNVSSRASSSQILPFSTKVLGLLNTERAHHGLIHLPRLSPCGSVTPSTYCPKHRTHRRGSGATWSPINSSEETEKAAIMSPSAGLSPHMEGTQGRKERGKARGLSWGPQWALSGPGAFHASLCGWLLWGLIKGRI